MQRQTIGSPVTELSAVHPRPWHFLQFLFGALRRIPCAFAEFRISVAMRSSLWNHSGSSKSFFLIKSFTLKPFMLLFIHLFIDKNSKFSFAVLKQYLSKIHLSAFMSCFPWRFIWFVIGRRFIDMNVAIPIFATIVWISVLRIVDIRRFPPV